VLFCGFALLGKTDYSRGTTAFQGTNRFAGRCSFRGQLNAGHCVRGCPRPWANRRRALLYRRIRRQV